MRELRITGVDTESAVVECEVAGSGEKFSLPLDDRLRAAARGEFLPSGSAERAPVTGTLRPREIQDRIRHGASPDEVAADAGVPLSRIEGFALPVLLERSNAAEMARSSHPVLPDGPALETLEERIAAALGSRGVDPELVAWDAWRERGGGWVVRTSWPAGLSDDAYATWSFVIDSHGGATHAMDEEAHRVLDPSRAAALRTVPSPPPLPPGPPPIRAVPTPASGGSAPASEGPVGPERAGTDPGASESTGPDHGAAGAAGSGPGAEEPRGDDDEEFLKHPPAEPGRRSSRRHPAMPSWEDVLLGVRSKDD